MKVAKRVIRQQFVTVCYYWIVHPSVLIGIVGTAFLSGVLLAISLGNASMLIASSKVLGVVLPYSGISNPLTVSPADCLVFFLFGMEEINPDIPRSIVLNMVWLFPFLLVGYAACKVVSDKEGAFYVVGMANRYSWCVSVLFWLASVVLVWVVSIGVVSIVVPLFCGVLIENSPLEITPYVQTLVNNLLSEDGSKVFSFFVLSWVLWLLAIGYSACAVALRLGPTSSFLLTLILLIASAYLPGILPFPDITMLARSVMFVGGTVQAGFAGGSAAVVLIMSVGFLVLIGRRMEWC